MGVSSNLEVFLSEKHANNNNKDRQEFIITPSLTTTSTIQEETPKDQEQSHHDDENLIKTKQQTVEVQEQQKKHKNVPLLALLPSATESHDLGLKIKIPPYNVEEEEETEKAGSSSSSSDGFKTPTGAEHRIPSMLECPPAPKKPKTTPSSTAKRRRSRAAALIDFTEELFDGSLFPSTPSVVDRCSATNKTKKVKVKLFTDDDEEQPPQ